MIRQDFIELNKALETIQDILKRVTIIGCGRYFKTLDMYCGHRYNWKGLKGFKMDLWLCSICERKASEEK
jgi:hypothetical protein